MRTLLATGTVNASSRVPRWITTHIAGVIADGEKVYVLTATVITPFSPADAAKWAHRRHRGHIGLPRNYALHSFRLSDGSATLDPLDVQKLGQKEVKLPAQAHDRAPDVLDAGPLERVDGRILIAGVEVEEIRLR